LLIIYFKDINLLTEYYENNFSIYIITEEQEGMDEQFLSEKYLFIYL